MRQQVLIVSHADADGHIIAEQTRRNLAQVPSFDVHVVVDPVLTKDHRVWTKLDQISGIDDADVIFFVDLMFGPVSFAPEAEALVKFVQARPRKKFFLVDHHPLPLRRLEAAENLRVIYRPEVFECAIGPRSGMMIVAALCEKQARSVADIKLPEHELLAEGMRRAAALGGPLPGDKLLALLRYDQWESLAKLGTDRAELHRLPRGRRPLGQIQSKTLRALDETAMSLLLGDRSVLQPSAQIPSEGTGMPYDFDSGTDQGIGNERFQFDPEHQIRTRNTRTHSQDLEAIVTLLEVAALSLTTTPDRTFTIEELVREAQDLGGEEVPIDERDIMIVLEKASFIEKAKGEYRLK